MYVCVRHTKRFGGVKHQRTPRASAWICLFKIEQETPTRYLDMYNFSTHVHMSLIEVILKIEQDVGTM